MMSPEQLVHAALFCLAFLAGYAYRMWVDEF